MTVEGVPELLRPQPLERFVFVMSSGERHFVSHSEFVIATTSRVIVVDPVTEAMHVLPLLHVAGIHTLHKQAG
jgi:hypothetical protein